jgi:phage baseplate assembly protein W
MATYTGFSTLQSAKNYTLTNFELAQRDLLNYFSIKRGEKLMQPGFGTIIWSMLFEPLDESTQTTITTDIQKIVGYDPRLAVGQVAITQQDTGFLVQLTLSYIPTNQSSTLLLNFNRNSQTLTTSTN